MYDLSDWIYLIMQLINWCFGVPFGTKLPLSSSSLVVFPSMPIAVALRFQHVQKTQRARRYKLWRFWQALVACTRSHLALETHTMLRLDTLRRCTVSPLLATPRSFASLRLSPVAKSLKRVTPRHDRQCISTTCAISQPATDSQQAQGNMSETVRVCSVELANMPPCGIKDNPWFVQKLLVHLLWRWDCD